MNENTTSLADLVDGQQKPTEDTDDKSKTPRHSRWTRQETLVLIEGKKIAEERTHRGRKSSSVFGSDKPEPKWNSVSSYCRQHGANRGPVQCRKRWSNMISDFRKIKAWESQTNGSSESYWIMSNDLRRERKLPGFFDREVYDVLDGKEFTAEAYQLALVTITTDDKVEYGIETAEEEEEEDEQENTEAEAVSHTDGYIMADDVLFPAMEEIGSNPLKEGIAKHKKAKSIPSPTPISGTAEGEQPGSDFWKSSIFKDGVKRKRQSPDGCIATSLGYKLLKTLEQNTNMLHAQLDAQIDNHQLDREQQKEHTDSLIAALNKVADALARVADKM
ncbi:trihelix transcription factor ASR3-like [Nicotiana sylvestris]|uniref:Trihelix transcription factor ASR3-like n=2 Tax=Nicotiana TaxID=4085 RepID=A0A1S4CN58_TOBAC|nr:PREDICTED: trihelix transcription factor GT-2-like [Nicotiana sylvestris]XP_016502485.1 PREDICTED: trihelix transcription factor ASR3-like [Nicotiana tabacum]